MQLLLLEIIMFSSCFPDCRKQRGKSVQNRCGPAAVSAEQSPKTTAERHLWEGGDRDDARARRPAWTNRQYQRGYWCQKK